jgi:CHAT domain
MPTGGRFERGDRVIVRQNGTRLGGRVSGVLSPWRFRVVTDQNRRLEVPKRDLRRGRNNVLILETRLDAALHSQRHSGTFLREFLQAYGVQALYERVHTKRDLEQFLDQARRTPNIPYIHFVAHGSVKERSSLLLTFERVNLHREAGMFRALDGKLLIFSSCDIGADRVAMERILEFSRAQAIIAYTKEIEDSYSYLAESLLYGLVFDSLLSPTEIVRRVRAALREIRLRRTTSAREIRSPLVCFQR